MSESTIHLPTYSGNGEGELVTWCVEPGERVIRGQALGILRMDNAPILVLRAPHDGIVGDQHFHPRDRVAAGQPVMKLLTVGTDVSRPRDQQP